MLLKKYLNHIWCTPGSKDWIFLSISDHQAYQGTILVVPGKIPRIILLLMTAFCIRKT